MGRLAGQLALRRLPFSAGQQARRHHELGHSWSLGHGDASTGRNELANDNVLLETQEVIDSAVDSRLGEDARGLLEGGCGQEAIGVEGGLGHPQENGLSGGGLATLGQYLGVHFLEAEAIHQLARQQGTIAGRVHLHAAEHLANDDLDMLIVDIHTLRTVNLLYLFHQVELHGFRSLDAQDVLRVDRSVGELLAGVDVLAGLHPDAGSGRHYVFPLLSLLIDDGETV